MSVTKLFKDSLVYGFCNTLSKSFLVLLVPLYTRLLTQAEFGVFDLVIAAIKILVILWGLQIESGTARLFYEARARGEDGGLVATAFWTLWVVPLLAGLATILFRKPLAIYLFQQEVHTEWLILAALIIPLMVQFFHTLLLFRLRDEKSRFLAFSLLNLGPAALVSLVLVWGFSWGVTGILVGQLSGLLLGLGGGLWTLRRYFWQPFSRTWLKELLVYGIPLVPAVASNWGQAYANRFLISAFLGLNSLALYSLAVNVVGLIMFVQQAFALAWLPHASWMMGQEGCENFFRRMLNIYTFVMGSLMLCVTLYAQELVALFGPPSYLEASRYVGFIAAAQVLIGCDRILAIGNCMTKKTYWNNAGIIAGTTCNLVGLYLTIPVLKLAGGAIWLALGAVVNNLLVLWTSQRNHRVPYNYGRFALFILFLGVVALGNLLNPVSSGISPLSVMCKAVILVIGVLVLGYGLLDRQDRAKGWGLLRYRLMYQKDS